jgi:hypothetical protein
MHVTRGEMISKWQHHPCKAYYSDPKSSVHRILVEHCPLRQRLLRRNGGSELFVMSDMGWGLTAP